MRRTTSKALCIGINRFKNFPASALKGCVNDAKAMAALSNRWGYDEVITLTDALATKANIMSHLKTMVSDAKAGKHDKLLLSISSHGSQVPDLNADEKQDWADEVVCPFDLAARGNSWDSNFVITDDEFNAALSKLPAVMPCEIFLDTCHSGTGVKMMDLLPDRRPRLILPPSPEALRQLEGRKHRGLIQLLPLKTHPNITLWAACRPDQTAADAFLAGRWRGAFTYFFEKNAIANSHLRPSQLLEKVRRDLAAANFGQEPQLEFAAIDRALKIAA
jgi:hypothetical protein